MADRVPQEKAAKPKHEAGSVEQLNTNTRETEVATRTKDDASAMTTQSLAKEMPSATSPPSCPQSSRCGIASAPCLPRAAWLYT